MRRLIAHIIIFLFLPIIGNIIYAVFFPPREEKVIVNQVNNQN